MLGNIDVRAASMSNPVAASCCWALNRSGRLNIRVEGSPPLISGIVSFVKPYICTFKFLWRQIKQAGKRGERLLLLLLKLRRARFQTGH